jgi:hypothetical protein
MGRANSGDGSIGVWGLVLGTSGAGVRAEAFGTPGAPGTALDVRGKARFSTCGSGAVAVDADAATVPNPAATAASHITVTLTGDPGKAMVQWVERLAGVGFTVHLSDKAKQSVPFTYLIVEPGTA